MAGLLETIFGQDTETIERVRTHTNGDRQKAEQAYGAAAGTILRGIEKKSKSKEGAEGIWDMLRKAAEQGKLPTDTPAKGRVEVRELDPKAASEMLKAIFGKDAPEVQGGFAKVVSLDPETTKQIFAKVLPAILGGVFGAAERDPEDSPKALPRVVTDARAELEQRQPKSAGIFDAILDRDHDGDVDMNDLNDLAGIFGRKPR